LLPMMTCSPASARRANWPCANPSHGRSSTKGTPSAGSGRSEDAIAVYDDVFARFGAASELALREPVARALVNKGDALGRLGRSEDAIAVYDDVIARFGQASELALRELVAQALINKGDALTSIVQKARTSRNT
jgi:tetratricopeptide (TPR) repeat protein